MTLVDTSVWVDHLRGAETGLTPLLNDNRVLAHPMVIGELACGSLGNRDDMLSLLSGLPQAPVADDQEVLALIEDHRLMGRGIGYIDAHLLAATALASPCSLWTSDRHLRDIAAELCLAHQAPG